MKRTIKNPTLQSGVLRLTSSQAISFNVKGYYTQLVSPIITTYNPCNTSVSQGNIGNTSFYIGSIHCDLMFYKNLIIVKVKGIFAVTTSYSGTNRTRQQAVFLRSLFGQLFKPIYGGLREGNTRPSGNILRRLYAVVITRHLNYYIGGDFTKTYRRT